jgi:adenylate kinase
MHTQTGGGNLRIILLGAPGAGKGTQAKTLSKRLNLVHISTGDILRSNVAGGTELGAQAKEYMNKGLLVPDELVMKMVNTRIAQPDAKKGFILDGYPRNITQAESLDAFLTQNNLTIDFVIDLEASKSVIIQRLSGRLACKGCNANFHVKNMPPKKDMVCDNCGGQLYQRADDKEETIAKRLQVYAKESAPLIKYYQATHKFHKVSADEDAEVVIDKVLQLVKERDDSLKV